MFSNSVNKTTPKLSTDFERQVRQAIYLIENDNEVSTDEEFVNHLTKNGIGQIEAVEILLFLPIAFVRRWLSTVKWSDTYIEYIDENKQIEKKYSETKAYQIIWLVTIEHFNDKLSKDTVFKIGGRSAEFNVINKLLLENPNSKLEEIILSDTVIIR